MVETTAADAEGSDDVAIAASIHGLLAARAADASLCPYEVARALWPDEGAWRARMREVRRVAGTLAASDVLRITQGEAVLPDADGVAGPIRLRRGPGFGATHD